MPEQIWYRGEGVNIPPAKADGWKQDLNDGLYFADTVAGAKPFAQRAPNIADQRLYQVKVDFDSIKVLNLTTDQRWAKYMSEPYSPLSKTPRIDFLKQMPSSTHYNVFFTSFLKDNQIELNQYDAVVGPLLQQGGNQMCVLHKNGQPSALAQRLRSQWIPFGPAIVTTTPRGFLKFNGKLGPGIKTVGGSLLALAITLFIGWLLGKFMEGLIRSEINRQLAGLEPEVQAKLKLNKAPVLLALAQGKKAFAELRFSIETTTTPDFSPAGVGSIAGQSGFPVVKLNSFQITDQALQNGGVPDGSEMAMAGSYARTSTDYFKTTVEIMATAEEVDLFRAYLNELNWYDNEAAHAPSTEDMSRLNRDHQALEAKLNVALMD